MIETIIEELEKVLKEKGVITFQVKVVPRSKQNEIVGCLGDNILKIKISALALKNKANKELIGYLSTIFKTPKKNIQIVKGTNSPLKLIKIEYSSF